MLVWGIWYQWGWDIVTWSIGDIVKVELAIKGDAWVGLQKFPVKKPVIRYVLVFLGVGVIQGTRRS